MRTETSLPLRLLPLLALALTGCERLGALPPEPPRRPGSFEQEVARAAAGSGHVLVLYPEGRCSTGTLEVQVYVRDPEAPGWRPHPEHPRIRAGSVQREDPSRLLNELRVRCVDPEQHRTPSGWVVGVRLRD